MVMVGFIVAECFDPIVAGFNNVGNSIGKSVIKGGVGDFKIKKGVWEKNSHFFQGQQGAWEKKSFFQGGLEIFGKNLGIIYPVYY